MFGVLSLFGLFAFSGILLWQFEAKLWVYLWTFVETKLFYVCAYQIIVSFFNLLHVFPWIFILFESLGSQTTFSQLFYSYLFNKFSLPLHSWWLRHLWVRCLDKFLSIGLGLLDSLNLGMFYLFTLKSLNFFDFRWWPLITLISIHLCLALWSLSF